MVVRELTYPAPLTPLLVSHIQPDFEVWVRVLWDFLYCPYEQSFQWKWRNLEKVDYLMESTPFDFFDPQVTTQYLLKKWTNIYIYIYTYVSSNHVTK